MRKYLIVAWLVALGASAPALAQSLSPQQAAEKFYRLYLTVKHAGVPDTKTLTKLAPTLSIDLQAALALADQAEGRYARKTKKQVPPLAEGDIFSSLFEGATKFEVGDCLDNGMNASCTASLTYVDKLGQKPTMWQDEVRLAKEEGAWKVDDVAYGGKWNFARTGTLKQGMADLVRDADAKN